MLWNSNAQNHEAAKKICVAVNRAREWKQINLITFEATTKPKNKRMDGDEKKPLDQQLGNQLF